MSVLAKPTMDLKSLAKKKEAKDRWFQAIAWILALLILSFIFFVIFELWWQGRERLHGDFFLQFPSRKPEKAGFLSAWVGSLVIMTLTAIFSVFIGVATGIFLEVYAARYKITKIIELSILTMSGIPSVLFGLFALSFFVHGLAFGESILTASLTLSLLALPILIVTTRETLRLIPTSWQEAAFALGATKSQWVWHHLLPYSLSGIITGVVLAMARILGEAAPLIAIGALSFIAFLPSPPITLEPFSIQVDFLWDSFTTIPIQVYNWISRPDERFHQNAAAAAFVLLVAVAILTLLAQAIRHYYHKKYHD
jgi:phosphate transport system permease protein